MNVAILYSSVATMPFALTLQGRILVPAKKNFFHYEGKCPCKENELMLQKWQRIKNN